MITLQNVNKYYYTETSVTQALRKVNLEFHLGEFVAITGESGSGKSTLLNIISGMDVFDEGEMFFCNEPTFQYDSVDWETFRREKIGFVFQNYNLIGQYSALENITGALLIMGMEEEQAKDRAAFYLEKVGLKGYEQQKASELSSGQKQRLSIARALAKETSVIVADEPTGNLDSETGEQIIKLLKELSENRLVIMVTHNYEQAAPYVTRKIRLHDGEIVVDVQENQAEKSETVFRKDKEINHLNSNREGEFETTFVSKKKKKEYEKYQKKIAQKFATMNRKNQWGRALLFRMFFLLVAIVSFVFLGQILVYRDDTSTRDYQKEIFYQKNDSRLSVRREDGEAFTEEDLEKIRKIRNVEQVDRYDYVNDMNYFCEEGKDYKFEYSVEDGETYYTDGVKKVQSPVASDKTPVFLKKNKFMKSTTCISKEDLEYGRIPEKRNEIVVYAQKAEALGEKKTIYFTAENIWGKDNYYFNTYEVVGILKEKTSQIYFHPKLCHMLGASADGDEMQIHYKFDFRYQKYREKDTFVLVANENIKEGEARCSGNYIPTAQGENYESLSVEQAFPGQDKLKVVVNHQRKGAPQSLLDLEEKDITLRVLGGLEKENYNEYSGIFVEVSEKLFQQIYPRESTQASVYIKNYTKTDNVIKALSKQGYTAISTYRVASVEYNQEKVMERLVILAISVGILAALIFIEMLILSSLMKIKIKDFFVLKSMGMQVSIIKKISLYEMFRYCVEAMGVTVIVAFLLNLANVPMIREMWMYYGVVACAIYVVYNLALQVLTVRAFNRLLEGRMTS